MTSKHFRRAAEMVRAIAAGDWTNEPPSWALASKTFGYPAYGIGDPIEVSTEAHGNISAAYMRAVWTAEFLILFFREHNSRFNQERFLVACGLADAPVKGRKR